MKEVDFESVVDVMIAEVLAQARGPEEAKDMCVWFSVEHAMSPNQMARLIGEVEGASTWRISLPTFH